MNYTLEDLIIAYKKVKNDIYHDKSNISIFKIVDFEKYLIENLEVLLENLNNYNEQYFSSPDFFGGFNVCLKSTEITNSDRNDSGIYFSNHFEDSLVPNKIKYRYIGDNSIEFQILGSLWIDKIGVHLEKNVSKNSYGCRLDRPFQKENEFVDNLIRYSEKDYKKLDSHFRPYFLDYKRWQENSLTQIEKSLDENKKIAVLTTDIKGFYHSIDPFFLKEFFETSNEEQIFKHSNLNLIFCNCLQLWSEFNYEKIKNLGFDIAEKHIGIPIGLSASKVIANLFLHDLDKEIENNLNPLYYGRYVDDLIIVIEDKLGFKNSQDFWDFFKSKIFKLQLENLNDKKINFNIDTYWNFEKTITLNSDKEKLFILHGLSGKTFIETIKDTMNENSSEWRLLPDSEDDLLNLNKEVTSSSNDIKEISSNLRQADGVSIKRMKFALRLRNFENFTSTAPKKEWKKGLEDFIAICSDFIITPENIATYLKYIPRIFGLTVSTNTNELYLKLLKSYLNSWEILHKTKERNEILKKSESFLNLKIKESILSNIPIKLSNFDFLIYDYFLKSTTSSRSNFQKLQAYPLMLFLCDLHQKPFKNSLFENDWQKRNHSNKATNFYMLNVLGENCNTIDIKTYRDFFKNINQKFSSETNDSKILPNAIYFSTRKLNALELSMIYSQWSIDKDKYSTNFKSYFNLFNIPNISLEINDSYIDSNVSDSKFNLIKFPTKINTENPKLVLTNFLTTDESWKSNVRGDNFEPDSSRFTRINRIINDILKECSRSKINVDYIVLPELSMPRQSILDIAKKLKSKGISLITGVEYEKEYSQSIQNNYVGNVSNQLLYILNVNNGKYNDQIAIIQEKTIPAIHEESELFNVGGMRLNPKNNLKYIIEHNNFFFGGLICNDLLNIDYRQVLRGEIDTLFVVEWNQDIDMYNHIISATSNDLHCYVAQVNNRKYGDTRLRGPLKESYERDVARVRGGELDYFVVSSVNATALREFQRFYRSPNKPFKPVPTGFKMSEERRKKDLK
ncbi:RNA-directed DNA polymerase [Flavobacterium terrae]|uniref:Reverse transcriptase (RNA-dependent DNA polymerase) n=1 Tax=Flavobacterium terrae TaxID=415425 RepID=A0A1M6F279_9FLAO|nr:RNA-directed DNA polymerase [Flavobacterium terrae]SHI91807.1 Reverse transcriptase (RNA-dependent DNA polymerase) [Flavobacterium terrae]